MEPFLLLVFFNYSSKIAFGLAWILTPILLYLIMKKTDKQMKVYSQILFQSAIIDLNATCIYAAFQSQFEVSGFYLYQRIGTSFFTLTGQLQCIAPALYGTIYTVAYMPIPFQCVYRYFIVCKKHTFPLYFMPIICFIVFIAMLGLGCFYLFGWTPVQQNAEAKAILFKLPFWENVEGLDRFCFSTLLNPNIVTFHSVMSLITSFGLVIIVYTSIKSFWFLKTQKSQMSQKTLQMHAQLGRRLILQTIIPFIMVINTSLAILVPYLVSNYKGGVDIYFFQIYPWTSVINCIATIISIKNYRSTLFSWMTFGFLRKSNDKSSIEGSSKLPKAQGSVASSTNRVSPRPVI